METFRFPEKKDIYIEINGKKGAAVESYELHTICENETIEAIGEPMPVKIVRGKPKYKINIFKLNFCENNTNLFDFSDFNMDVVTETGKIRYTGCHLTNMKRSNTDKFIVENVEILATDCMKIN